MTEHTGKLNIIGAGQLGKTLGRLLHTQTELQIGDVLNQSVASAQQSVEFIGDGRAVEQLSAMHPAEYYLLACPDKQIETCCQQLAASGVLQSGMTVFHCSGALASDILNSAAEQGAQTANVHPVRSFANPVQAVAQFSGTYCGMEGDEAALTKLEPLFQALGAIPFRIDPAQKTLYHAASVMACNYLVALQEISLQAFEQAGVKRELGMKILQPLVQGTVENVFAVGTVDALTGPVARGEHEVVAQQLKALQAWSPEIAELYAQLGQHAVGLAAHRHESSDGLPPNLVAIANLFAERLSEGNISSSADTPS